MPGIRSRVPSSESCVFPVSSVLRVTVRCLASGPESRVLSPVSFLFLQFFGWLCGAWHPVLSPEFWVLCLLFLQFFGNCAVPGIRFRVLSPDFLLRKLVPDSQFWFPVTQFLLRKLVPDSKFWFPVTQFLLRKLVPDSKFWFPVTQFLLRKLVPDSKFWFPVTQFLLRKLVPDSKSWFPVTQFLLRKRVPFLVSVTSIAIVCSMVYPASRTVDDLYARIGTQKLSPVSSDGLRNSLVYSFRYLDWNWY